MSRPEPGRRPRDERAARGLGGRFYGLHAAVVTDISDPAGQGRIEVELPWSEDPEGEGYRVWARLATLMAGADRGSWFVPDVADEVVVGFAAGDPRRPYVVGSLWNGADAPPESMDSGGENHLKVIHSRNGVRVALDDDPGAESLTLETPAGQTVKIDDGGQSIRLEDVSGNSIEMSPSGITITATAQVKVDATTVQVSAASVTVDAPISRFSGLVQADTVVTNTVVSPVYTPGAGNIW